MPRIGWRKIETALIDLLREEGFEIEQSNGDSYIRVVDMTERPIEINIGDFAKELEERL